MNSIPQLPKCLAHNRPVIVNAQVTRDENCYPMVAPGKNNAQMIGLPKPQAKTTLEPLVCGNCGTENQPNHNFCSECGTKL